VGRKDEMGEMMEGLQQMQERLAGTVRSVREGSDAIATASSEIAAGNLDLSRRTEQQAANLEETASSLEELTSTVKPEFRQCAPGQCAGHRRPTSPSRAASW
jgi:methyl-accepting chemotaxis protein